MSSELERMEEQSVQADESDERLAEALPDVPRDIDWIMDELDAAYGYLPREAILAARRAPRDEMVARLIEAIRQAIVEVRDGFPPDGDAHYFALFLLCEFRAREALPVILDALSLPGEGPFEVFDDVITEYVTRTILTLADDPLPVLEGLAANRHLNTYVRWQGVAGYLYLVRDGRLSREDAVQRLLGHLRRGMEDDPEILTPVLSELTHYDAREGRDEIRAAVKSDAVDPYDACERDFGSLFDERASEESPPAVDFSHRGPAQIDDTIEEMQDWACFQEDALAFEDEDLDDEQYGDGEEPWLVSDPPAAIFPGALLVSHLEPVVENDYRPTERLTSGPKIGRNERCPCGSGQKFKKCCGARR